MRYEEPKYEIIEIICDIMTTSLTNGQGGTGETLNGDGEW